MKRVQYGALGTVHTYHQKRSPAARRTSDSSGWKLGDTGHHRFGPPIRPSSTCSVSIRAISGPASASLPKPFITNS